MQLSALFRWWIYIAIVHAPVVLSSSFSLERALFDVAPDESLFSNEFSLEETDPSNQDVAPDWNGLLADNDLDPITEFDLNRPLAGEGYLDESGSNFLLADNDVACDSDAENTQLFGKVRRENLCRDPRLGQTGGFSQKDPFDEFNKLFTITDPLAPFPEDSETCPKRNFENSNIPVCKEEIPPDDIVPIPRTRAFSLFNIDPGAAVLTAFDRHSQSMLIDSAKLSSLVSSYSVLKVLHCGVAKVFCTPYVFLQTCPTSSMHEYSHVEGYH